VRDVVVSGKHLVVDGNHVKLDVASDLAASIAAVTG
jgi:hypothetical protein